MDIFAEKELTFNETQLARMVPTVAEKEREKERASLVKEIDECSRKLKDALDNYHNLVVPFTDETARHLKKIREQRVAVVMEISQISKALAEVRTFFLGKDYHEEIARLREFVELCERLEQLKKSGFLDSVADTLLKLA